MGYLIEAWKMSQKKFHMSLKQVVANAGDGSLENDASINELREFYSLIDLETMERLMKDSISKDKKDKFDTRGFAFQDLVNEMGKRLGYRVENGLYRGKRNEVGFDGLWKSKYGTYIIMESKTSDDYSIAMESIIGYRDKLLLEHRVPKKKCSILIVYGRDEKGALRNTVKGSDEARNIRLISANALFQLVKIFVCSSSAVTEKQINNLLLPRDYFILDNLVELVFPETAEDISEVDELEDDDRAAGNNVAKKQENTVFPEEPLKVGKFVRETMNNLSASGYEFTDEMVTKLLSDESMHEIIGLQRRMPFFKRYEPDNPKAIYTNGHPRYYKDPITFGKYTVWLNSQLFEEDREPFIKWIETLTATK